jgi:release factor glutamine methyltransferase
MSHPDTTLVSRSLSPLRSIAGSIVRFWLSLRYRRLGGKYGKLVIEEIDGVPIVVLPEVFNPVLLRSGEVLARFIGSYESVEGAKVLDLGAGSGIASIFAARRNAQVTAVDVNPAAVRCARINALLNEMDERIKVVEGDLFEPVSYQKFDLVLFNPPFHRGKPIDNLDKAWRGETVFERFADGLADVLRENGRAFVLLSTDGDGDILLSLLKDKGYKLSIVHQRDFVNEVVAIFDVNMPMQLKDSENRGA